MEDLISRQAVLDLVVANHTELNGLNVVMYSPLYKDIKQLPSVTPKPKTGHWVKWYETIEQELYTIHDPHCKCSECNREYDPYIASLFKYCPNCGAKMETEEKHEEKN